MLNKIFEKYPSVNFVKEINGRGGYKNIFVKFTGKSSIAERGQLLMNLEDELINNVDSAIRIWHEPLGDKNTLRTMRGVTVQ